MLEQIVKTAYKEFTLRYYHELFARFQDQETGLTATEIFAAEAIRALGTPTVNEFAAFMHVSTPNAAYKINSLVRKGYVEKTRSAKDKREYLLHVTQKYETYCGAGDRVQAAVARIRERFTPEECAKFGEMLSVISEELLPVEDGVLEKAAANARPGAPEAAPAAEAAPRNAKEASEGPAGAAGSPE